MKFGIMATGPMAQVFVDTLSKIDKAELYAVASRSIDKAITFKEKNNFEKAYGSYPELVKDENVEIVYIATPQSTHYELMKLCIENHKPVLCEKAFTINAKQAKEIKDLAKKNNVFVAEALWPRYMPSRKIINDVINSGIIGTAKILTGNLSYVIYMNKRIVDINLGGGALLDVGVYGLNFALMHFGSDIEKIDSSCELTDTGVDGQESITLHYKDGRMAVLTHGIYSRSDRKGIIYGDKGYIVVENINNPTSVDVYDCNDVLLEHHDIPKQISGYEYEIEECIDCISNNKIETNSIPLQDSIELMEVMDKVRNIWGLKYPEEKEEA